MKNGMALITVIIITLLLFAIIGSFLFLTTNARIINERYHENLIALGLAEAGVDYAIWEINFGGGDFSGWSGTNPKTTTINNFQDAYSSVYGDIAISVYNPGSHDVAIISQGTLSSITGPTVSRRVRVLLKEHKLFKYAILAAEIIDINGNENKTDSYDSSLGPYGGANIGTNGDIITNGRENPAISIQGDAAVNGDATTGPGGTISVGGSAELNGTPGDDAEVFMPSVIVPESLTSLSSGGAISLGSSDSLELFTGNYKYNSLDLTSKAKLILNGDVNLYFTQNPSIATGAQSQIVVKNGEANIYFNGDVSITGQGVLNEGGYPSNLTFYGTDSVTNISLAGIGAFYGCFYAPTAEYFYISGNSNIYGSVVGKNVSLTGNAAIHYDERLMEDSPTIGYDPYAWQEK